MDGPQMLSSDGILAVLFFVSTDKPMEELPLQTLLQSEDPLVIFVVFDFVLQAGQPCISLPSRSSSARTRQSSANRAMSFSYSLALWRESGPMWRQ